MIENFEELKKECLKCTRCGLCQGRHNVVFGVGNPNARVLLVGEGPGENEDLQGEPFVGRAGKLLDTMLDAVDLSRERNIYIANIVKCRPPQNRDPLPEEQEACIGWLRNQFAIMRPKIIVCLGRIAAGCLIHSNFRITREHGRWFPYGNRKILATFHPSALLRDPSRRPEAFMDLREIRREYHSTLQDRGYAATSSV